MSKESDRMREIEREVEKQKRDGEALAEKLRRDMEKQNGKA